MTSGIPGTGRDRSAGRVPVPPIEVYVDSLVMIPPELFEQVQRGLVSPRNLTEYATRRSHASNIKYVLSGIAICDRCGHQLRLTSSTGGYRRIGCTYKIANTPKCKDSGYPMASLERVALRGLRDAVLDPVLLARFEEKARSALDERERNEGALRRRLEDEAKGLKSKLDSAMQQTFSHRRLSERREALLEAMENQLEELEDRINALSLDEPPTMSPDALPSLCAMFDELEVRAPFLPKNAAEAAVFATLRRLITSARVRRVDRRVFEATVEYDLGPVLGIDASTARLTKTLRHDSSAGRGTTRDFRVRNAEMLLSQGAFELSDEMLATLSNFPTFQALFANEDVETRRSIIRSLLFAGAHNAPQTIMRKILGEAGLRLRDQVKEFRNSPCVPSFVAAANAMFPDIPINSKAIQDHYDYKSRIHSNLVEEASPFLQLEMCRAGSGSTRIPDDRWHIVTALKIGVGKKALQSGRGYDTASSEKTRRTLEAIAIVVREGQPVKIAAQTVGLTHLGVTTKFSSLRKDGRLRAIAEKLLELEAGD